MAATIRGITLGRYSDSVDAKDDEVTLLDNKKIYLGTGSDLELYHDGSNSRINDAGTGNLQLQVGGTTKLEVTGTGISVTGDISATGSISGTLSPTSVDLADNEKVLLGTGDDLELYHDGSNSLINDTGTGNLKLQIGGSDKLEVTSTGVDITGNLTVSGPSKGVCTNNLVINGNMSIAQRGTSSTSNGYYTIDRWHIEDANTGQTATQSQQSLSSSDTGPWEKGFRNYARIALATAGTANAGAYVDMSTKIEAQNMASSGWEYTSTSSYINVSFWFRVSTNQTFYAYLYTPDTTAQGYAFSFTASGNNTWTKITHTIPGNANITFDNNNGAGLQFFIVPFYGTDFTNNKTLNTWAAHSATNYFPDMASTWLTAGTSTFDATGFQLEIGQVANDFKHESIAETLAKCQRYYWELEKVILAHTYNAATKAVQLFHPVVMRATPTETITAGAGSFTSYEENSRFYSAYVSAAHDAASAVYLSKVEFSAEL